MIWAITQATEDHAHYIAPRMTAEDAQEVRAGGWEPLQALLNSLHLSIIAKTWLVEDEPACMFGLAAQQGLLGGVATPWMLGTMLVRTHRYAFLRNYRAQIDQMLAAFPALETMVDARHRICLRWLKKTGFQIDEPLTYGLEGLPFHRVRLERSQSWAQ